MKNPESLPRSTGPGLGPRRRPSLGPSPGTGIDSGQVLPLVLSMTQHFHFSFPVEREVHSSIPGSDTAVCVLCSLLQEKSTGSGLLKNATLEEWDAQNLEVVAFCEDVAQ